MDYTIETFDDAIEYISGAIGSDFEKALRQTSAIIANPSDYTGQQASMTAVKMGAYRYKIGLAAQYWKLKSSGTKKLDDRLIKDALMSAFTGLEEVINTLKAIAREEREMVR